MNSYSNSADRFTSAIAYGNDNSNGGTQAGQFNPAGRIVTDKEPSGSAVLHPDASLCQPHPPDVKLKIGSQCALFRRTPLVVNPEAPRLEFVTAVFCEDFL